MSKVLYPGRFAKSLSGNLATLREPGAADRRRAAATPPRRIFIDCSAVDFDRQPTGIPRVVRKYIEVGYAWGARRGVEVIPVIPAAEGLFLVRPVPGRGAPAALLARAVASEASRQSSAAGKARAVFEYLRNVVHHASQLAAAVVPIPPVKSLGAWIESLLSDLTRAYDRYLERGSLGAILFAAQPGDVVFAPAYWHDVDPAIYRGLRARGATVVILVHDLLPIVFEQLYPSPWRYLFRDNVAAAFGHASAFFCVSRFTQAALSEFGQRIKAEPVPMMTAYNGFEPLVGAAAAAAIGQPGHKPLLGNRKLHEAAHLNPLLMVGSVEPKKGHVPVIRCLEALWRVGYRRPLLIIGRTGWLEQEVVAAIRGSFFFEKKIFWFSDADDYDLATAYLHSHALVFSSLAEGFGIPMIEAAYYGKPTIALDTPVVREVLGDNARLFATAAEFVQHVVDLEDAAIYGAACRAAASVRWPLWEDYTPQVFERLLDFAAGKSVLPDLVPAKPQPPVPLREASD